MRNWQLNTVDMDTDRIISVDVFKGLLILFVVIGHAFTFNETRYIFWFHMPAFFMVSGFFLKPNIDKNEIKKKFVRLVIPYLTFSFIFGFLARGGNIPETMKCTLYGGFRNTTPYTGPYYFINALFVSIIFFYLGEYFIQKSKVLTKHPQTYLLLYCIILYLIPHISDHLLPACTYQIVPWAVDDALCVTIYLLIGRYMYKYIQYLRGGACLASHKFSQFAFDS